MSVRARVVHVEFKPGDFLVRAWILRKRCECGPGCAGFSQKLIVLFRRGDRLRRVDSYRGVDELELIATVTETAAIAAIEKDVQVELDDALARELPSVEGSQVFRLELYSDDVGVLNRKIAVCGDRVVETR